VDVEAEELLLWLLLTVTWADAWWQCIIMMTLPQQQHIPHCDVWYALAPGVLFIL
jgi:hypothetical protein